VHQFIRPFEEGSKAVEIHRCEHGEECRFKGCEEWIQKHVASAKKMLKDIGLDEEQLKIVYEEKK
jgi:coenzyme F420-reducing hydrogenase delta subunit